MALRQVYVSAERHGEDTADGGEAARAPARGRPDARDRRPGRRLRCCRASCRSGRSSDVARAFGDDFAAQIDDMGPGQWSGPIASPYGLHLVLVVERTAAANPPWRRSPDRRTRVLAERRRASSTRFTNDCYSATRSRSTCRRRGDEATARRPAPGTARREAARLHSQPWCLALGGATRRGAHEIPPGLPRAERDRPGDVFASCGRSPRAARSRSRSRRRSRGLPARRPPTASRSRPGR